MSDSAPVLPVLPVLRVLNGRLAGTEKQLPQTGRLSIGNQYWQDVVIRDPATKGIAVDLSLGGSGGAQITVLDGEATLLGSTVPQGGTALLPPYVPFMLGGIALAWGDPASDRWNDASGLALAAPSAPAVAPSARDHALAVMGQAGENVGSWLTGRRAAMLGGIVVLALAALFAMPIADALGLRAPPAARVEAALGRGGFAQLTTVPDVTSDGVRIVGMVRNERERARVADILRATGVAGTTAVQTSAELAQASVDVARLQGVRAVARPTGLTGVMLRTTPLDQGQEARLIQAVRRDVRQVTSVIIRDDLPLPEEAPPRTVADVTKKVSTVVAGDPFYIQTVDGARYFSGAMMPSGHRLVGIEDNTVVLEKNGRETRLSF